MVNKVILIGNLGKDPEIREAGSTQVCKFSLATSDRRREVTEWHNIVTFGKIAEVCNTYLHKGSKAFIEGRIQTSSWEKDGEKKYRTEIIADSVQFLDPKGGGQTRSTSSDDVPF